MAKRQLPSPEVLRQLLRYEPETGELFWRKRGIEWFTAGTFSADWSMRKWNTRHADKRAISADDGKGYLQGTVLWRLVKAHRVAWAIHHGTWPEKQIDHINGIRSDNRILNLRCVTNEENARNRKLAVNNTSGVNGVYWDAYHKVWKAFIVAGGRQRAISGFSSQEDAAKARRLAEMALSYSDTHGRRR